MTEHLITPPPELIRKWNEEAATAPMADQRYIAIQAARWGADQELEACIEWLWKHPYDIASVCIRDARRPKPPSLKEQALAELEEIMTELHDETGSAFTASNIRRALEALPE